MRAATRAPGSPSPPACSLYYIDAILSGAVVGEADIARGDVAVEAHPLPHCLYGAEVAVHARVHALLPAPVLDAGVAADVAAVRLAVGHALAALLTALGGAATGAVGVAVREAVGPQGLHEGVGGEQQLDLPVGVGPREHLDVEVAVPVHVLLLHQHRTSIPHVSGGRARELVIVAVELDGVSFGRNGPAAERELFGVVALPDLDLGDVLVGEPLLPHEVGKAGAEVVGVVLAHEQSLLPADDHLQVGDEVIRYPAAHVGLELREDGGEVGRGDVLGGVDSESGEAHAQQRGEVVGDALPHVLGFGVEVSQVHQPPVVQDEAVGPGVQRPRAVEVVGSVGHGGRLHARLLAGDPPALVREALRPEGRAGAGVLVAPVGAAGAVGGEHVVPVSDHVVDHSVGVDPHALLPAGVDHPPQLLGGAHAGLQLVAHRLVQPVPGVQLPVLGVLEVQDGLGGREDLHAQVACLSDHLALVGDVVVGPAEHLDDGALLAVLVVAGLVDRGVVPHEIHIVQPQLRSLFAAVKGLHTHSQQAFEAVADEEGVGIRSSLPKIILEGEGAVFGVEPGDHSQVGPSGRVGAADVAHDDVVVLVGLAPERVAPRRSLEGAVAPGGIVVGLLPAAGILVVVVVTRVPEEGVGEGLDHHCAAQQHNQPLRLHLHLKYKQSYQSRLIMSSKVAQYLGRLHKMGKMAIIQEARKMGLRIMQKSSREESLRALEAVQHRVIEEYLEREAQQRREVLSSAGKQTQDGRVRPVMGEELQRLRVKLLEIDRIHLNQYSQLYYQSKGGKDHPLQDYQGNAIDGLLGIRNQIFLSPAQIRHEYQYPFAQLQREIFPTIVEKEGVREPKAKGIAKLYDPSLGLKDNLLLSYGLKKEREFNNTHDSLEGLLFRKVYFLHSTTLPYLLTSTHRFGSYYAETMAGLQASNLAVFIRNISGPMDKAKPRMASRNYFCLTLAEGMLRSQSLLIAIEKGQENGKLVLAWIYRELAAFIGDIEAPDNFKELDQTFLKTLKKYSLIKLHLMNSRFSGQVPQSVLVGTESKQWPQKMLVRLQESVEEVGVGDLGGRRVVERLAHVKEVAEFVAVEGLELGRSFLEKLLLSVRSGLDWLQHQRQASPVISDPSLAWQLQTFYSLDFSKALVKLMFLSTPTKEDRAVLHFLWHKFLNLQHFSHQSTIQHLFLLINVTIRNGQESLLQDQKERLYNAMQLSIQGIFKGDLSSLKSEKVINFMREEGTVLLEPAQKQALLALLQQQLQQPPK